MKFMMKSTEKSRLMAKLDWHPWFAWYPVLVNEADDYSKRYAFLETVARKGFRKKPSSPYIMAWEYNALEDM